jgi:hypothetical protein
MALLEGFNIANVERVKIVTDETTPLTHVFQTANSATATPAVSAGQEVEQRVKNAIKGLLRTEDIVKGYDLELEDQRVIIEVFSLIDGGAVTGSGAAWTKYTGPAAGASVTRKSFTLYLYTSDRDTDGGALAYHEWVFPGCKGKAVPLNFADAAFSSMKYSITSRPASGVAVIDVNKIDELPAVA